MNRSKIEWCDHTWNPITGCLHNCHYCYAKKLSERFSGDIRLNKMAKGDYTSQLASDGETTLYILDKIMMNENGRAMTYPFGFEPTFHKYRFDYLDKLKNGHNIFVGAMADVFGDWVPDSWIDEVIEACVDHPEHNYMFLTKNPKRYSQYKLPTGMDNMWFGTSITRLEEMYRIDYLPAGCKTFLSIEPLLESLEPEMCDTLAREVDWIIIGAETGNRKGKIVPAKEWIHRIVLVADTAGVPVFMKDSLIDIVGEKNMRREFPKELKRKTVSQKVMNKLYDVCCTCGGYEKKSDMYTLLARKGRGVHPKQYAFMCEKCFVKFCEDRKIEIPNFEIMEDTSNE